MTTRTLLVTLGGAAIAIAPAATMAQAVGTSVYQVPFASSAHTIEFLVANSSVDRALEAATVNLAGHPAWLAVEPSGITLGDIAPGSEAVASFSVEVRDSAPVAEPAEVVFSIEASAGLLWTRSVRLVVEASENLVVGVPTPNPIRASTTLTYELPTPSRVQVSVVDLAGREIAQLIDAQQETGRHQVSWHPNGVASGVYVCRLVIEDASGNRTIRNRKMTLLR